MSTEDLFQEGVVRIQSARTIAELELSIESLLHVETAAIPWSVLNRLVKVLRYRIAQIDQLEDFASVKHQTARDQLVNCLGLAANWLAECSAYPVAVSLLVDLWNKFADIDVTIQRAGIATYLGLLCSRYKDYGEAMWWLLHAHADDVLRGNPRGGSAYNILEFTFGVGKRVFDCMETCHTSSTGRPHELFAEHLVTQLSLESDFVSLFSNQASRREFPIGYAYMRAMIARLTPSDAQAKYPGKPLEELVRYLTLLMSGWVPTKNTYHDQSGVEHDVIARYTREPEAISSSHPRAILMECKNLKEKLDVSEIGYFLYRMTLTQAEVGVIFSRNDVTGDEENEYARYLLNLAFQQNSSAVVVINLNDLEKIKNGEITLWTLIDTGINKRRFGSLPKGQK